MISSLNTFSIFMAFYSHSPYVYIFFFCEHDSISTIWSFSCICYISSITDQNQVERKILYPFTYTRWMGFSIDELPTNMNHAPTTTLDSKHIRTVNQKNKSKNEKLNSRIFTLTITIPLSTSLYTNMSIFLGIENSTIYSTWKKGHDLKFETRNWKLDRSGK